MEKKVGFKLVMDNGATSTYWDKERCIKNAKRLVAQYSKKYEDEDTYATIYEVTFNPFSEKRIMDIRIDEI